MADPAEATVNTPFRAGTLEVTLTESPTAMPCGAAVVTLTVAVPAWAIVLIVKGPPSTVLADRSGTSPIAPLYE